MSSLTLVAGSSKCCQQEAGTELMELEILGSNAAAAGNASMQHTMQHRLRSLEQQNSKVGSLQSSPAALLHL
jgi:hypothetical protein